MNRRFINKIIYVFMAAVLLLVIFFGSRAFVKNQDEKNEEEWLSQQEIEEDHETDYDDEDSDPIDSDIAGYLKNIIESQADNAAKEDGNESAEIGSSVPGDIYDPESGAYIPEYTGQAYVEINGSVPFFESYEYTTDPFENYSSLDDLGRCGQAYANICRELMPTDEREGISEVKPSGWNNKPYDFIEGGYVYNRCHLIAFELAGENANELNLITGTRYFNVTGMLPFENAVANYVRETDNHVLYRVTPVFDGDNLVADGVLMEAYSVEDSGAGISFNVFVYNVQPGIAIDYATGDNWADGTMTESGQDAETTETGSGAFAEEAGLNSGQDDNEAGTYILNTNSIKFHRPECDSVATMSEHNKQEFTGSRQTLIDEGYAPCGACNP